MGWPEAVVAIIIIVTIGRVMRSKYRAEHGILEDRRGNAIGSQNRHDPQTERLQEEVKYLKERVAVLEKIATDDRGARELENEIEKLRDR
ncbi:MAG: hypothetical protein GW808_11140 [Sphingomonadales bacterium]|nr:hypothetical protein [Sphingomonadales bacterium]PIX66805.1 MAG: hypothetical protein COZ43_04735 [Sphingomonadales bacterium CG_4_10_14_3_um_filter_58_15]NCO48621.1 hypothetical protein [Sphingomonadales bacterium]NCO98729.1 hypothetical protein [Sphingomonadales bacterium]NCP28271.1 hypothetical protein [Sphingomonadales bacterium]